MRLPRRIARDCAPPPTLRPLTLALSRRHSLAGAAHALVPAKAAVLAAVDAATVADAAGAAAASTRYSGWLSVVADPLEDFLLALTDKLRGAGVPFPQGTSIIILTAAVKAATFPFTKRQIESAMAMQNLQPQVKALRERWAGEENAARLNQELSALYKRYEVSPLAGCAPTLLTLPVLWGTYRALINGSVDGAFAEPFYFLPSLAGPTAGTAFSGLSWLYPFTEGGLHGAPPIGWEVAQPYLILPVCLVVSQYISTVLLPPTPPDAEEAETDSAKTGKLLGKVLPLVVGGFSLTVPAGLGLYWLSNNLFTTAITYYLKFGGGAMVLVPKLEKPKLKLGTAIRSGEVVAEEAGGVAEAGGAAEAVVGSDGTSTGPAEAAAATVVAVEAKEEEEEGARKGPPPLIRSKRLADAELRKTESNPGGFTRLPTKIRRDLAAK